MEKFLDVPYFVWLMICVTIAIVYLFVVPKASKNPKISMMDKWILKYAHSLVWILLAMACILANFKFNPSAKVVSLSALVVYAVFMFTMIRTKMADKKKYDA